MNVFTVFSEDYFYFIEAFCKELLKTHPDSRFSGLGIRRKTVNDLVQNSGLNIGTYEWLNDKEKKWLSGSFDLARVQHFEKLYGTDTLRDLIVCDREVGHGFLTGGVYARTPLRKILESDPQMRWVYICNMLEDMETMLLNDKVNFVFMTEITHIWELALYHVAKRLNIPCSVPFYSRFGDRFVLTDNPYNIFTFADQLFQKSLENPKVLSSESLSSAKKYVEDFRNKPTLVNYSQHFKKQVVSQSRVLSYLKTFSKDCARWVAIQMGLKGTRGFLRQRNGTDILRENFSVFSYGRKALRKHFFTNLTPDLVKRPYYYYPLHYEPEASTMVFSPKLTNQLAIIENAAKSLPAGYQLIVKEHIPCLGRRPRGFYEKIKQIPDVVLINPFADNFSLIKQSALTLTITGTAGWEALLNKVPVVVLGRTQYLSLGKGFEFTENTENLTETFKKALQVKPAPDDELFSYIAAMIQDGVYIPVESFVYSHYGTSGKEFFSSFDMKPFVDKVLKQTSLK